MGHIAASPEQQDRRLSPKRILIGTCSSAPVSIGRGRVRGAAVASSGQRAQCIAREGDRALPCATLMAVVRCLKKEPTAHALTAEGGGIRLLDPSYDCAPAR